MLDIILFLTLFLSLLLVALAIASDDVYTKILMMNSSTSTAALFMCFLSAYQVNSSYIDIAIIYFLLGVVASCGYMRYFLSKNEAIDGK